MSSQSLSTKAMPDMTAVAGAGIYTFRILERPEELEELRAAWSEWATHPNSDIEFYALLTDMKKETAHPVALAAFRDGVPAALMTGFAERVEQEIRIGYFRLGKLKAARLAFGGIMGGSSREVAQAFISEILRLLKQGDYDVAEIGYVPTDSDIYQAATNLAGVLRRGHFLEPAPHWRMNVPGSMKEFLASRSKKHRYWLNRLPRVLEKDFSGKVKIAFYQDPAEVEKFAVHAEAVARMTYQRKIGAGFADNQEFRRRLELTARHGWFRGYILYIDEQPRAFWGGTLYKDVFFLAWTGYDPALRRYELGTILFMRLIEDLIAQKAQKIDFGFGTASYKERFGDHSWLDDVALLYAPTIRAMFLNGSTSLSALLSRTAKGLLRKLNLESRLKARWRRKLAPPNPPDLDSARQPKTG